MTIRFENRREWNDFINSFNGEEYSFAIKLDGSYCLLSMELLSEEYIEEFPIVIEAGRRLIQICGVKLGDSITLCSFREMKELAGSYKEKGTQCEMLSKVICLDDWYDSNRRYEDVLNMDIAPKLIDYYKKAILVSAR